MYVREILLLCVLDFVSEVTRVVFCTQCTFKYTVTSARYIITVIVRCLNMNYACLSKI